MILDDLKNLDPRNPGQWPLPVKLASFLGIFVVVLLVAYFVLYSDQLTEKDRAEKQEETLKTTFIEKKKLAVNLEAYKTQRAEIEQSFGALLKQLPTKSEMDALLIDINQAGLGRGLQFELFKPAPNENFTEFYAELPVNLKVTGNYHDLGAFASDVAKLPRIVLLNDLHIQSGRDGGLSMDATAKTYRYLDAEELAKQRKAGKAPAGPAKPGTTPPAKGATK
jgi:type IV pilus assembly protein PilO